MIGQVKQDGNEEALLSIHPKFATRRKLKRTDMLTDLEMASAKRRYQIQKENNVRELEDEDKERSSVGQTKRFRKLNEE